MWREKAIQQAAQQAGHSIVVAGPNMHPLRHHVTHNNNQQQKRPELVVLPYFNFTSQHCTMPPINILFKIALISARRRTCIIHYGDHFDWQWNGSLGKASNDEKTGGSNMHRDVVWTG